MTWTTGVAAISCLLAILTSSTASATERSDKTEAQQIEQLRTMVLQLQDRVDGLERQLNERRTVNAVVIPPIAAPALTSVGMTSHGPSATPAPEPTEIAANVPSPAIEPVKPQTAPQPAQPQPSTLNVTSRIGTPRNASRRRDPELHAGWLL